MQKKVIKVNSAPKIKTSHYHGGKVESKTPYVNGKQHGMERWWYESGKKYTEEMWRDGKLHGVETWWYESGQKKKEIYHIADKEYALLNWNEGGNIAVANIPTHTTTRNLIASPKNPAIDLKTRKTRKTRKK